MDPTYSIKGYLTPITDNILRAKDSDRVGPTLENTRSSHEAVFVFDDTGRFLGLISPQQAFMFERCPYFSRIKHCLFHPPHITLNTKLYDAADFMLFSKTYALPVFEDDNVKYIIKADKILQKLSRNPKLIHDIEDFVTIQKPITKRDNVMIEEIFDTLMKKNISRIILVDKEGDLSGIVSRRDLEDAFIVTTPRQRFGRREQNLKYSSYFDEEQVKRLDAPVTMFYTKKVLAVPKGSPLKLILQRMLEAKKNSAVIVDGLKPAGFVSRHDLLKAIAALKPKEDVQIIWEDSEHDVGEYTKMRMIVLLKKFGLKFKGKSAIKRMEIHVDAIKNAAYYDKIFYIRLHVDFQSGRLAFAYVETRDLIGGTREAIKRIENQFDLSDRQKHRILH